MAEFCHLIRYAYFGLGMVAAHRIGMDSARVIARAWTVHCVVIGILAVTCLAVCVTHWPVHGAPGFEATNLMLAMSGGLVVYALATSLLLHQLRTRCGAVYAIHVLGIVVLGALAALA